MLVGHRLGTGGIARNGCEQNAIRLVEGGHGIVEQRLDVGPVGGSDIYGIHLRGDLFAQLTAGLAAHDINGFAACDLIQPGAEDGAGRKLARVLGELEEGGLSDFLGQLWRAHLPQRGGVNEVEVPADQFREGLVGPITGEAGQ